MTTIATNQPGPLDVAVLAAMPLAAVPLDGRFVALGTGRRLLAARDGFYIEAANASLYVRWRIAACVTPWGPITDAIRLRHGPIPLSFAQQLGKAAREAHPREMAALVLAESDGAYSLRFPPSQATGASVSYSDADYAEDALVIDAHSHGQFPAIFSRMDDDSDRSRFGPHLSVVFGRCNPGGQIEYAVRLCVGDYLLPIPDATFEELFA